MRDGATNIYYTDRMSDLFIYLRFLQKFEEIQNLTLMFKIVQRA
jgi:hypothetical protein